MKLHDMISVYFIKPFWCCRRKNLGFVVGFSLSTGLCKELIWMNF